VIGLLAGSVLLAAAWVLTELRAATPLIDMAMMRRTAVWTNNLVALSAMSALVVAAVPPSQTGVASGMNANIRTIGGSIGAAAMASIVASHLTSSGLPKQAGYTTGFAAMAVGLVLATEDLTAAAEAALARPAGRGLEDLLRAPPRPAPWPPASPTPTSCPSSGPCAAWPRPPPSPAHASLTCT
jgi:hypothetical protein